MSKYLVAHALGVVRGIIENEYQFDVDSKHHKAKVLRENLDYLQSILVDNHPVTIERSAVPQWLEPGPITPNVQVVLGKKSEAWASLNLEDLLKQAYCRAIDFNLSICDTQWKLSAGGKTWTSGGLDGIRWHLMNYILASINDD